MKLMKLLTPLLLIVGSLGCERSEMQSRHSLHEHDHLIPPHWPEGLGDAVIQMRSRMALLQSRNTALAEREIALSELRDLVDWLPEIAAETDLSETEWLPVYHASEHLSAGLGQARSTELGAVGEQVLALCELADQAVQKLAAAEDLVIVEAEN